MQALSHDRLVDREPTDLRHAKAGVVLPRDVSRGVEICVQLELASATLKDRLAASVGPFNVTTVRTALRRVPWVYAGNDAATFFGLVFQEATKATKAPRMHTPSRSSATLFGSLANVFQVLNDDHGSRFDTFDDSLREDVVAISPETFDATTKTLQMALGRRGAFGLKTAAEPKVLSFDTFPSAFAVEEVVACDGGTIEPEVYADDLLAGNGLRWVDSDDDMQPKASGNALQIGAVEAGCFGKPGVSMLIRPEGNRQPTFDGGQTKNSVVNVWAIAPSVVTNREQNGFRLRNFPALLSERQARPNRLGGADARRANELRRQLGKAHTQCCVGCTMQLDTVALLDRVSVSNDLVEASSLLSHGFQQCFGLFRGRIEVESNGTLHNHSIGHFVAIVKTKRKETGIPLLPECNSLLPENL